MLNRWAREAKHRGWQTAAPDAKKVNAYVPSPREYQELENENDKLKRILGEKDLEIEILRDLLKKNNPAFRTKLK
jgi:transposase-like protein